MNKYLSIFLLLPLLIACSGATVEPIVTEEPTTEATAFHYPEWSKDAVIYEVNVRQYTEDGSFQAFQEHLPRLEKMGVDILWLMPIHPIGIKERKGGRGSYYSVMDYKDVSADYGSKEDFQNLVDAVHASGMKIIIDWVPNHTSWDNVWMEDHPDFYTKDSLGNMIPPIADWSDVVDLNYDSEGLRDSMISALKYWITDFGIDGYRCDVAELVPMDFWVRANTELRALSPEIFMLAEADKVELSESEFHMTYGWENHHILNEIAKGNMNSTDLAAYLSRDAKAYGTDAYRMYFTSNHDENTWNGTVWDRMGGAAKTMAALTFVLPNMPLIYSGQEDSLAKQLAFFEKDEIEWSGDYVFEEFYTDLIDLKTKNPALWNGEYGGSTTTSVTNDDNIFIITRTKDDNVVQGVFNLSKETQEIEVADGDNTILQPWEYFIVNL